MTGKRYLNVLTTGDIKDTVTGELIRGSRIGDLLNDLNNENEQLRTALKELKEIGDYQAIRIKELSDENEQLRHDSTILIQSNQDYRKENEQLKKENKRLDAILGEECVKEHMKFLGETALKEMHDEKYGDLE